MKIKRIINTTVAVALTVSAASAQQTVKASLNSVPAEQVFAGSDTFNVVMDVLLNLDRVVGSGEVPGLIGGINASYQGVGSSNGERYMLGVGHPQTPVCTLAVGSTVNTGCQEVAAMSRPLGSTVCSFGGYNGTTNINTVAEGLAVARDGVVILGSNAEYQQYSTGACTTLATTPNNAVAGDYSLAAPGSGQLADGGVIPGTTYNLGAGALSLKKWQDVIRLVYTGCAQDQGNCSRVPLLTRCTSDARVKLLNSYGTLFKGANCGGPGNCTQLRKAYRHDDGSGTTDVFLELIGVDVNYDLTNSRRNGINGIGRFSSLSTVHSFCDGFDFEGVLPSQTAIGVRVVIGGDPIRRPCAPEDDVCASNGTMGVVRAIISTPSGSATAYPKVQCSRGSFALTPYFNSALNTCPDGSIPVGGSQCWMPFYLNPVTGRDFNCINDFRSRPPGASSSFDGRVYNAFIRDSVTGAVATQGPSMPRMANWRENMVQIDDRAFGAVFGPFAPSKVVCQLNDATQNIGCLVGNTTCAWGYAGREAAALANATQSDLGSAPGAVVDLSLKNEAFTINGFGPTNANIRAFRFPFARELFFNSVDGFENLTARCLASGRRAEYCADEKTLALAFYNNTAEVKNAFTNAGFVPLPDSICRGARSATVFCGAVNTGVDANGIPMQAKNACLPN